MSGIVTYHLELYQSPPGCVLHPQGSSGSIRLGFEVAIFLITIVELGSAAVFVNLNSILFEEY